MSLNSAFSAEAAERLAGLQDSDFAAIVHAASLGLTPSGIAAGVRAIHRGEHYALPNGLGTPRPLTINAWSFVNDPGQYRDTYGLADSRAGELRGLLRTSPDEAIEEITKVVSQALSARGSTKPVKVTREGMPGVGGSRAAGSAEPGSKGDLKRVIIQNPSLYGFYKFTAVDSGRPGPSRFEVSLGGGLYATGASKTNAVDAARICRVHGRDYDPIAGRVMFWVKGATPLFGADIPEKASFSGILAPDALAPDNPVSKAKTASP